MLFPVKSLLAFEAVARNGSFTKAAEELSVTQSAVSHQIRKLEEYFSTQLLDRSGYRMNLTEDGEILFTDLTASMMLMRRSINNLKNKSSRAVVGLSVRPHFAMKWLSPRLRQANFNFDFHFHHTNKMADFSNPDIHASIEWLHQDHVPENAHLLVNGNLTPACNPEILKTLDKPVVPEDLKHYTLLHEAETLSWEEWLKLAGEPDLEAARNIFYSDTNVRQQAAVEKLGFALVCPELVQDDISARVLTCPFEEYLDSYAYYLIVPEDRMELQKVRQFVRWIKAESEVGQVEEEVC